MNQKTHTIEEIPIEKIAVPITHPRRDPGDMKSLEESIRKRGLQEPITVTRSDDGIYQVIDGTRRLTILASLGAKSVTCYVREPMDQAHITLAAYEINNERKSFNPIENALHIQTMQERFGYSLRELEVLGYGSPSKISQILKLIDLPESVKDNIASGRLTPSHGGQLSKLSNPMHQERMAKQAINFGWSAKKTELKVDKFLRKEKQLPPVKTKAPEGDIPGVFIKDAKDMSELIDNSVHLIVGSPNYHVGMEFEKGYSEDEHWTNIQAVIDEMVRVTCPGGIIAINVGDMHNYKGPKGNNGFSQIKLVGHLYQKFLSKHGVYLKDIIIWCKATHAFSRDVSKAWSENTPHTGYGIHINHDFIYVFQKKGERELPSEDIILRSRVTKEEWDKWATSVWMIDRVRKMDGHPAMFPEELVYRLVRMYSYEGDVVLDPFLGSGTTVKVARELGRQAFGYERLEQYKEVIMKKLGIEPTPKTYPITEYVERTLAQKPADIDTDQGITAKAELFHNESFAKSMGLVTP